MKPLNSSSLPSENTPGKLFTRRLFLKLAGASALALPFLNPEEALAAPDNSTFHRGCNYDTINHYTKHNIHVSGVRHYGVQPDLKNHIYNRGGVPTTWPARINGCRICLTVYPQWKTFHTGGFKGLNTGYDTEFQNLFYNALEGDMISVFQEPENIHWISDGYHMTADRIRTIQNRMLQIRADWNQANPGKPMKVAIGGIGFRQWGYARDYMAAGMDFYAVDLYHSEFPSPQDAVTVLNEYHRGIIRDNKVTKQRPISVCECNAHFKEYRPCYFRAIAHWVANQSYDSAYPTRCFHTFWKKGGRSGGEFLDDDTNTIRALQDIGNGTYTTC